MPEEILDDNEQESSPVTDEESESSTEETQVEEEVTSLNESTEEPQRFDQHPRFKELIEGNRELKEDNKRLQQQMFEIINQSKQPNKEAIEEQLYEANTPEEKRFWQQVQKIADVVADKKVQRAKDEATQPLLREIQGYQKMVGEVIADRFIEKNPDIKKGSLEMGEITREAQELTKLGMPITQALEKARKIVMFEKVGQLAVDREKKRKQEKIKQKEAANIETKTIPQTSLPSAKSNDFGEIQMAELEKTGKELGYSL